LAPEALAVVGRRGRARLQPCQPGPRASGFSRCGESIRRKRALCETVHSGWSRLNRSSYFARL